MEGQFRSLKVIGIIAFTTFAFVWAWISIEKGEMYIPPAAVITGLGTLIGGRLIQTYAEKPKDVKEN